MPQRTVTIGTASGLHARPASLVSGRVAASGQTVTIGRDGQPPVDASSVLMLMGLGLGLGEDVVLTAEDDTILDELEQLLAADLDAQGPQ